MNRRGIVFMASIALFVFLFLSLALFVLTEKYNVKDKEGITRFIGQKQADVFMAYQRGEFASLYATQSLRLASEQGVSDIAKQQSGCGSYLGYSIWSNGTTECFNDKEVLENIFINQTKDRLGILFSKYSDIFLSRNNLKISLSENDDSLKLIADAGDVSVGHGLVFDAVRVTHYYSASEVDFPKWSTGAKREDFPNWEIFSWCVIPESQRGFYEEVQCQGSGVSKTGQAYSYSGPGVKSIQPTPEASTPIPHISTARGTIPVAHKTIAVAPDMIPYGSKVKIEFIGCRDQVCCDAWNGEYLAEDTGIAMTNDWNRGIPHIDLYVGEGKQAYADSRCLPDTAKLEVLGADQKNISGSFVYSTPLTFKNTLRYSFYEYASLQNEVRLISEDVKQRCLSRTDQDVCLQESFAKQQAHTWKTMCSSAEEQTLADFAEALALCSQSQQEGYCDFAIPETATGSITIQHDAASNKAVLVSPFFNYSLSQPYSFIAKDTGALFVTSCEKTTVVFNKKSATVQTTNCANEADGTIAFIDTLHLYNKLSPEKKTSVISFMSRFILSQNDDLKKINPVNRQFRICTESSYAFYNESSKKEPILYKVSFNAGDSVIPEKVKSVVVKSTENQEQNITITFAVNTEEDMDHYNIYYSATEFADVTQQGTVLATQVSHSALSTNLATINVSKDQAWYVAVTPVDKSGNENKVVSSQKIITIDQLPPAPVKIDSFSKAPGLAPIIDLFIIPPKNNSDGSQLTDFTDYVLFAKIASGDCLAQDISSMIQLQKETIIDKDYTQDPNRVRIDLTVKSGGSAKNFCIVAIAADEVPLFDRPIKPSQYTENSILKVSIP